MAASPRSSLPTGLFGQGDPALDLGPLPHDNGRSGDVVSSSEALGLHSVPTPPSSRFKHPRHPSQPRGWHERARNASSTSVIEKEHGVSPVVGAHRSPYPSATPYFLTVVPPLNFPVAAGSDPSHLDRLRRGALLPLYPTLGGQLWAISREYGLPSIGGLLVYLAEDVDGNLGPQVGDAAWSALWSRYFADDDSAFSNISFGTPVSRSQKRADRLVHEASESVLDSNDSDLSRSSDAEAAKSRHGLDGSASTRPSPKLSSKNFLRREAGPPGAEWSPSSRSIAWSGRGSSLANRTGGSAPAERLAARLPIVGKIEWIVDQGKAAWWDAWSARKTAQEPVAGLATRRSMHLNSSLPRSFASKAAQPAPRDTASPKATGSSPSEMPASRRQSTLSEVFTPPTIPDASVQPDSNEKAWRPASLESTSLSRRPSLDRALPSQPAAGIPNQQAAPASLAYRRESADFSESQKSVVREGAASGISADRKAALSLGRTSSRSRVSADDDSYAGYSALLEDDETHDEEASEQESEQISNPTQASIAQPPLDDAGRAADTYSRLGSGREHSTTDDVQAFVQDAGFVLDGADEDMWRDLQRVDADDIAARGAVATSREDAAPESPRERSGPAADDEHRAERDFLLATPNATRLSQSAIDRHVSMSPHVGIQTHDVHDWIKKTAQSPRLTSNDATLEADETILPPLRVVGDHVLGDADDALEPSRDDDEDFPSDVREVVSLWATKVAQSSDHLPLTQPPDALQRSEGEGTKEADSRTEREHSELERDTLDVARPSAAIDAEEHGAASKQSLLSPFALDSAAFAGPRPQLGDLASQPALSSAGQTSEGSPHEEPTTLGPHLGDLAPPHEYSVVEDPRTPTLRWSAPKMHQPDDWIDADVDPVPKTARSPLAIRTGGQNDVPSLSRRSSGELSDSLEDMQKALELLTPSHSPNPGAFPSGKRVPSRDSFAFAKTLSASVTPSPRWLSRAKARQSRAEPQSSYVSTDSAFYGGKVSPRPASASAAMIGPRRNDLQVPISASRLAQFADTIQSEHRSPGKQLQQGRSQDRPRARNPWYDEQYEGERDSVYNDEHDGAIVPSIIQHQPGRRETTQQSMEYHDGSTPPSERSASPAPRASVLPVVSAPKNGSSDTDSIAETGFADAPRDVPQLAPVVDAISTHAADGGEGDEGLITKDHASSIRALTPIASVDPSQAMHHLRHISRSTTQSAYGDDASAEESDARGDDDDEPRSPVFAVQAQPSQQSEVGGASPSKAVQAQDPYVDEMQDESGATVAAIPEPLVTPPLRLPERAKQIEPEAQATETCRRLSVQSEVVAPTTSPRKKEIFGPTSLSMYTLRDSDIEALSGDPEQGMASIERFLRGNSFAESSTIPSVATSPGNVGDEKADLVPQHGDEIPSSANVVGGSGVLNAPGQASSDVADEPRRRDAVGSERWSQGSQSQSTWTGPSRQSIRSSSNDHDREPDTPVFVVERQLGETRGDAISAAKTTIDATVASQTMFTTSPDFDANLFVPASPHDADVGTVLGIAEAESLPAAAPALNESDSVTLQRQGLGAQDEKSRMPSKHSDNSFGMTDDGDTSDRALDADEIRQMNESTRAAVREALSFRSSPDPICIPQSPTLRSPVLPSSPSPSSPVSMGSFSSMSRRRTSASSLSGRKPLAPLNLDIEAGGKTYVAGRRSGTDSPNQRFRTLPPSPRMIPSQFGPSSPLSATYPSTTGNSLSSPTSKLTRGTRSEDTAPLSFKQRNNDLC